MEKTLEKTNKMVEVPVNAQIRVDWQDGGSGQMGHPGTRHAASTSL